MQQEFAANCLNANYETLMHFENYNPGSQQDDLRMYINNAGQPVNLDDEVTNIVLESFKGTRKFLYIGAIALIFQFFALFTLVSALIPLMDRGTYGVLSRRFNNALGTNTAPSPPAETGNSTSTGPAQTPPI